MADAFSLVNLAHHGSGRADREEQFRIYIAAGGLLPPVRLHYVSHRILLPEQILD
jgi:hypothetical protein